MRDLSNREIRSKGLCLREMLQGGERTWADLFDCDIDTEGGTIVSFYYVDGSGKVEKEFKTIEKIIFKSEEVDCELMYYLFDQDYDEETEDRISEMFEKVSEDFNLFRYFGPTVINLDENGENPEYEWWREDVNYTIEVEKWMKENKIHSIQDLKKSDIYRMWMEIL